MLGNLIDEVMRRRLWPILAVAVLVAIAAPLLFLKSAPSDAPSASATPPATAREGRLPARAQRLLATSGAQQRASQRSSGDASDPFQPPTSHAASAKTDDASAAAAAASAGASAANAPVPVVITNADGTKPATPTATATTPQTATTAPIGDGPSTTKTAAGGGVTVDVRYGEQLPGTVHHDIPRLQTFIAGGRVIAIFVKYSPKRHKAVFAIAPKTLVSGDVECRRKEGLCRYVDIAAGDYVRLTTLATDGRLVSRRLDVTRTGRRPGAGTTAAAAGAAPSDGSCLLGKMLALTARDAPLAGNTCKR